MVVLKKSDILKGTTKVEKYMIESLEGEVWLRPLSNAELNEIDEIEAKGIGTFETNERSGRRRKNSEVESKGKIDLARANRASASAKARAIYLAFDNEHYAEEKWTETEVDQLNRKVFNEIFEKVQEISGVDIKQKDIDDFPEDE